MAGKKDSLDESIVKNYIGNIPYTHSGTVLSCDVLEDKTKVPLEVNTDTEINFDEYLKKEENKVIQNNKPNRLIPRKCTINNQVSEIDKRMSLLEIKTNIIKKVNLRIFVF